MHGRGSARSPRRPRTLARRWKQERSTRGQATRGQATRASRPTPRNACVLATGFDHGYGPLDAGPNDSQVEGYGCVPGFDADAGNVCAAGACGDAVRESTLFVYVR